MRLLPNGSEDPAYFGAVGTAGGERISGVQPLPDGSAWVWGNFTSFQGLATKGVARLRSDGSVDSGFRSMLPADSQVESAGMTGDGGALVVVYGPSGPLGPQTLIRLTATGAVASSISADTLGGGRIRKWVPRAGGTRAVRTVEQFGVAVIDLRADGSVEQTTSYSAAPFAQLVLNDISPDGIPLFSEFTGNPGSVTFPSGHERLLRLVADAANPEVIGNDLGDVGFSLILGLSSASDGRVLVWGTFRSVDGLDTPASAVVLRQDGTWDANAVAGLGGWKGFISLAVAHPAGGWVVAGSFSDASSAPAIPLLRLDAAGQVDGAWVAAERSRGLGSVGALAAAPTGILVFGRPSFDTSRFVRIRADGTDDPVFQSELPSDVVVRSIEVLPDGRIFAGPRVIGTFDRVGALARLLPDGRLDPAFDRANARSVQNFAALPDGGVVLLTPSQRASDSLSEYEPRLRLRGRRLFADGSIDPSFAPRERYDGSLTDFRRLSDGRFLVEGTFLAMGERFRPGLARLTENGELDAQFRPELPVRQGEELVTLGKQTDSSAGGSPELVQPTSGGLLVTPRAGPDSLVRLLIDPQPSIPGRGRGQLANVSSRGRVEGGDRAMIAGFVVAGGPRRVVVRALGPSLAATGVVGTLANPSLEILSGGTSLAVNDDWSTGATAAEVSAAGLAPSDAREAAVALTLPPGSYTAVVRGSGSAVGVGIVEAYILDAPDLASPPPAGGAPRFVNLSTRAYVGESDNVMIGGFIIRGGSARVALRGLGPTLAGAGVPGTLADPYLRVVRSESGRTFFASDSWQQQPFGLGITQPLVLPRPAPSEIGTVLDLPEGNYTVIISGVSAGTGIGMFEVYELPDNGTP